MRQSKEPLSMRLVANPYFVLSISIIAITMVFWRGINGNMELLLEGFIAIFIFTILNIRVYREYKQQQQQEKEMKE